MGSCHQNRLVPAEELAKQLEYAEKVKVLLEYRHADQPLAYVHVYGCQQNVSDGERIKGLLAQMGYGFTENQEEADLVLFNTCAVRGHAEDRVYGNVGALKHLKNRKPGLLIALCGCMMQQQGAAEKIKNSYPHVNLVFGTHVIHRLPELVYRVLGGQKRVFELPESDGAIAEGLPVRRDGGPKGWLPVMYGCNNFCTYCIVPYVRGRERSRTPEAIVAEAKELLRQGYKEITLLGQNVNSYGRGLEEDINFAKLLRQINDLPGDFIIRFMTSHPKDCTMELLDAMRDCEKVERHLHLPVQAGSNRVLAAMNRRYTREEYLHLVDEARERIPDLTLTSDIIVGFPGETYEEFLETVSLIEQVRFGSLFTFIFSPREGTPAAKLPDEISQKEKARWLGELLRAQEQIAAEQSAALVGKKVRVLCEEAGKKEGIICGRTTYNTIVEFEGPPALISQFAQVQITGATNWVLSGKLL